MASSTAENEIAHEFLPAFRIYKDGRVEKFMGKDVVPASVDPNTGVQSKDVEIAPEIGVSARLYIPKNVNLRHKRPLLVYFHGKANVVLVSVGYRLALLLPNTYEDVWVAVKWVASQLKGDGQEPWLKVYVDFESVFFGGDSSGEGTQSYDSSAARSS
ncbi:unnamed protein product [Ilex paraguariensis]|uniref:Alpha/beta hydrolase fold-3 domain-containing protein n=1 Tax=Ilex paraguariensis TaxID=185542 RepID=A0ABC8S1P7_9AQUA